MTDLQKPTPRTYYDYWECLKHVEAKYGINVLDVNGKMVTWMPRALALSAGVYRDVGRRLGIENNLVELVIKESLIFIPKNTDQYEAAKSLVRVAAPEVTQAIADQLPPEPPHQDFTYWLQYHAEELTDGLIAMKREHLALMEDWERGVAELFFAEFAPTEESITFSVPW